MFAEGRGAGKDVSGLVAGGWLLGLVLELGELGGWELGAGVAGGAGELEFKSFCEREDVSSHTAWLEATHRIRWKIRPHLMSVINGSGLSESS
jgi:hypothetical protein